MKISKKLYLKIFNPNGSLSSKSIIIEKELNYSNGILTVDEKPVLVLKDTGNAIFIGLEDWSNDSNKTEITSVVVKKPNIKGADFAMALNYNQNLFDAMEINLSSKMDKVIEDFANDEELLTLVVDSKKVFLESKIFLESKEVKYVEEEPKRRSSYRDHFDDY